MVESTTHLKDIDWDKFRSACVLVVGDVMLDTWLCGSVHRISPEAPVPVVNLEQTNHWMGGAANVARNIASLGSQALLMGAIGNDQAAGVLQELISQQSLISAKCVVDPSRPTTTKTRLAANNHQIARIDQESSQPLGASLQDQLWTEIERNLDSCGCVIVSDYAKGVVTFNLMKKLALACRQRHIPLLVDPKSANWKIYQGASLVTPNWHEFCKAVGYEPANQDHILRAARQLCEQHQIANVLITRAEKGMTLVTADKCYHVAARLRAVADVSGAGDTVIALMSVALANRFSLNISTDLANCAAGISVSKPGTATVTLDELRAALSG